MRYVILPVLLLAALAAGADVGVDTILAPVGTIDSGQLVIPRCVVANYADSVSSVKVHFGIFDAGGVIYIDSLVLPGLAADARDTVRFTEWVIELRDSLITKAWTTCAEDTNPANDTCSQKFFARVKDVGVIELLQPRDTLDSGTVITPTCRVWNFGNQSLNFDMRFRIWRLWEPPELPDYECWRSLTLPGGGSTVVAAPDSWTAKPGVWILEVLAVVPGDQHPENNVWRDTFWVRGGTTHDVGVVAVLAPPSIVDTATTVTPSGCVKNFTRSIEWFWVYFGVSTEGGTPVYIESVQVMVGANETLVVDFPSTRFPDPGLYVMVCSTDMPGDQNSTNDVLRGPLRVVPYLQGDLGILWTVMPHDTVDTLTTFSPTVRLKNYGTERCSTYLHLLFADTVIDRTVYAESLLLRLAPGAESSAAFPSVRFTVLGEHTGRLWIADGDTVVWRFLVAPLVGVEESPKPQAPSPTLAATVIRDLLVLPRDMTEIRSGISDRVPRPVLLDAAGRKVMALHPGANDVSGLAPGIYFVREPSAVSRQPSAVRKVILQR